MKRMKIKKIESNAKPSVLITGAYGGMGKATAQTLKSLGFRVFALDKNVCEGEEDIFPVRADITDENSINDAFRCVSEHTDNLYAVIHFAGVYMLDSLVEIDNADFDKIFRINLEGVFLINKIFFPMLSAGSRIVITTSELAPLDPLPFTGIYAVTKSALDRYAYSLRMELQLKKITVSVLRAGAVSTGMLGVSTDALESFCRKTEFYNYNAERFKQIVDRVEARSISPSRIADKTVKILNKKNPRFAYSINRNPLLLMLNALPKRVQLWIIKQVLTK